MRVGELVSPELASQLSDLAGLAVLAQYQVPDTTVP